MKEYDIFLKRHLTESNLFICSLPYRDGVSVTNRLMIEAVLGFYTLQKMLAVSSRFSLSAEIEQITNTVYWTAGEDIVFQIDASIENTNVQVFESISSDIEIRTSDVDLFYLCATEAESAITITQEVADTELHYPLGMCDSRIAITASEPDITVQKYLDSAVDICVCCAVEETLISLASLESLMAITASAVAGLKRFRLLYEVDPLQLEDMDEMTLEELDYVILED